MPFADRLPAPRLLVLAAAAAVLAPLALAVPPAAAAPGETVVGELVQGYADPEPGEAHAHDGDGGLLSWVRGDGGDTVRVPTEDVAAVEVGATVEVTLGATVRDQVSADGLEPARDVLAAEQVAPAETPATAPTVGPVNHPVTVVMLQPKGVARDATTLSRVVSAVGGAVGDFWERQTGGAVRFGVVQAVDWGPEATVGCDRPLELWQQAARRAGWSGAAGSHLLVYVPAKAPGCSYGLGTVGRSIDDGGLAYVQAAAPSVIAHEFGHNLGLGHSSEVQCDRAVDSGTCQVGEYRDPYDVMGISWERIGTLNAVHAAALGVLRPEETVVLSTADGPVDLTLAPVSAAASPRAIDLADADGVTHHWLEYRQAGGQDAWLADERANRFGLQAGVVLRRSGDGSDTSLLLDATPSARDAWAGDLAVALPVGTPVRFAGGRFTVTVTGVTAGGATVRVVPATPTAGVHLLAGGDTGPQGTLVEAETCDAARRCTARYQHARVFWSPATGGHSVAAPELAAWEADAGALGYPTRGRACSLRESGCFQPFEGGGVYSTPATGTHAVSGDRYARWAAAGWEFGALGYPVTGAACGLTDGGCYQHFQRGSLMTGPVGTWAVSGPLRDGWFRTGSENGALGYPAGAAVCGLRDGGCLQRFGRGALYWSPATGARAVTGAAGDAWARQGWEGGPLGYPVTDTTCGLARGGCYQHFQGGTVMASPASGSWVVSGGVRDGWFRTGSESGALGYPAGAAVCRLRDGGCFQRFEGGPLYWSRATGGHAVTGPAGEVWARQGWEGGPLGYPVTGAACGLRDGGCYQHFQGGTVLTSPASGSWAVSGALRDGWFRTGSETGALGYPPAAAVCGLRDGGCLQRFQGGALYWSPATGAHPVVPGAVGDRWAGLGWERGLGYPLESERAVAEGRAQRFEYGTLTWVRATGEVRRS
ncbi:MAG TPA: hypothetical protein VER97_11970 [Geodermatophilus sp.]|nr:hypothetical protein [Geodermatophilus sp.]